jgi:hypothetical protein
MQRLLCAGSGSKILKNVVKQPELVPGVGLRRGVWLNGGEACRQRGVALSLN